MRADGDAGAGDACDGGGEGGVGLELDDVGAGFADVAGGVADGLLVGLVVRAERQVGHDDGVGCAAFDGGSECDGDVEGHLGGARQAEDDFGGGVAGEDAVDAAAFEPAGGGGVVGGEAGEGRALACHACE